MTNEQKTGIAKGIDPYLYLRCLNITPYNCP